MMPHPDYWLCVLCASWRILPLLNFAKILYPKTKVRGFTAILGKRRIVIRDYAGQIIMMTVKIFQVNVHGQVQDSQIVILAVKILKQCVISEV